MSVSSTVRTGLTTQIEAKNLAVGMVVKTWFGSWQISDICQLRSPHDFVLGYLKFYGTTAEMSITKNDSLEVCVESLKVAKYLDKT